MGNPAILLSCMKLILMRVRDAVTNQFVKVHGMGGTKEYHTWASMRHRCTNPKYSGYRLYGAKGIKVCDRWLSFENFFTDMGPAPSKKHSLDRINPKGNYEPGNCRWVTNDIQQNNKSNNLILTLNGESKTFSQWCRAIGMAPGTLYNRIRRGMSDEEALTKPIRKYV